MLHKFYGLFVVVVSLSFIQVNAEQFDTVVTMGNNTKLDGFTITGAAQQAHYGNRVD